MKPTALLLLCLPFLFSCEEVQTPAMPPKVAAKRKTPTYVNPGDGPTDLVKARFTFDAGRAGFVYSGRRDSVYYYSPNGPSDFDGKKEVSLLMIYNNEDMPSAQQARALLDQLLRGNREDGRKFIIHKRRTWQVKGGEGYQVLGTMSSPGKKPFDFSYYVYYHDHKVLTLSTALYNDGPQQKDVDASLLSLRFK